MSSCRQHLIAAAVGLLAGLGSVSTAHSTATITVVNLDGAGEGFNDTQAFIPVGGNPATTLGQARQQMLVRDTARETVEELARGLASASDGETTEAAVLQSGGWQLRATAAPVGPLSAPENLSATGGDMEGEADLSWQPVNGRDAYLAEHAPAATGP